jgi:hypothetical protein
LEGENIKYEELHNLYFSPNSAGVIKKMKDKIDGACSTNERGDKFIQLFKSKT